MNLTDPDLCFDFVPSFLYQKESFLTRYFSCSSQVCRFYFLCSTFFDLLVLLLAVSSLFFLLFADVIFPLDDAGWTRAVLILVVFVFCVTEDEQTFSHSQVSRMIE